MINESLCHYAHYAIFAGKSVHGSTCNGICPYQPRNKLRFLFLFFFLFKQKQPNNTGIAWTNVALRQINAHLL